MGINTIDKSQGKTSDKIAVKPPDKKMVSEHFSYDEFTCKCGCKKTIINQELIALLEKIRARFGRSVTLNCGTRCDRHNAVVGGEPNSKHLVGEAADIEVAMTPPSVVANAVESMMPQRGGIGRYRGFTHVDVRKGFARWRG